MRCKMLSREDEKEIVLAAVSHNGRALKYASDALEKDEDVIMASIKENGLVLSFVGKTFQSNLGKCSCMWCSVTSLHAISVFLSIPYPSRICRCM